MPELLRRSRSLSGISVGGGERSVSPGGIVWMWEILLPPRGTVGGALSSGVDVLAAEGGTDASGAVIVPRMRPTSPDGCRKLPPCFIAYVVTADIFRFGRLSASSRLLFFTGTLEMPTGVLLCGVRDKRGGGVVGASCRALMHAAFGQLPPP